MTERYDGNASNRLSRLVEIIRAWDTDYGEGDFSTQPGKATQLASFILQFEPFDQEDAGDSGTGAAG